MVRSSAPPRRSTVCRRRPRHVAHQDRRSVRRSARRAPAKRSGVGHGQRAAGVVEGGVDVGEVVDVRPVQDRRAELGRLDRVLAAVRHERAAHEDERRQAVEQAQLADGVGDIDVGRRAPACAAGRAPRARRPGVFGESPRSPRRAAGWRGARMVRRPGRRAGQRLVAAATACSSSPGWVLAATQTGRPASRPESCARARASAGGGRRVEFEVAGDRDPRRAEPRRAARRPPWLWARQSAKRSSSARATCGQPRPAPERALRHAPVDQDRAGCRAVRARGWCSARFRTRRTARGPAANGRGSDGYSAARRAARTGARRRAAGGGRRRSAEVRVPEVTSTLTARAGSAARPPAGARASRRRSPHAARRGGRAAAAGSERRAARRGARRSSLPLRHRQARRPAARGSSSVRPPR